MEYDEHPGQLKLKFNDIPNHEKEYLREAREPVTEEDKPVVTSHMRTQFFKEEGWYAPDEDVYEWYWLKSRRIEIGKAYTPDLLKAFEEKGAPSHKNRNVGASDYATRTIQPWDIWREYALNPWDADIVKRTLRTKEIPGKTETESRIEDYEKIQHICEERIAQLNNVYDDERLHSLTH